MVLRETDRWGIRFLLKCIDAGEVVDFESDGLYDDYDPDNLHDNAIGLYLLLDYYSCPDFLPGCRHLMASTVKRCLETSIGRAGWGWDDGVFIRWHYNELANTRNGGSYPEDLVFIIADVWCLFEARQKPCPKLDALLKETPELNLAVGKIYVPDSMV